MHVLIKALFFLLGLFFCIMLSFLVCPCYYSFAGNKKEKLEGMLFVRIGFCKLCLCREVDGENWYKFYILGQKLVDTQSQAVKRDVLSKVKNGLERDQQKNNKKIVEKKKGKVEKQRRWFFSSIDFYVWREFLERETFSLLLELCKKAWLKIRPSSLLIKGRVGFVDPYYTGLLAAALYVFSSDKIDLEPDFSQPICELTIIIAGRVFLIVLIYYLIRLLLLEPFRSKVWDNLKWC